MTKESPIEERALLVSLNISQWQARKRDKAVTQEVTKSHAASTEAGNFNKSLLRRDTLAGITKAVSAARTMQEKMTLAWGDKNERILSAALFVEYSTKMEEIRHQFDAEVAQFCHEYPTYKEQARKQLGTMYDPQDYPIDVRDKFSFKVSVFNMPRVEDFRVSLSTDHVEHIKREMTREYNSRQKALLTECYEKLRVVVKRISENCSKEDPKIYDSLMGNAREMATLLPALNLTNDPELAQAGRDLEAMLVPTNRLKADKSLRTTTANKANELLARISTWA